MMEETSTLKANPDEKPGKGRKRKRTLVGTVVGTRMQKTAVVLVRTRVLHKVYKKYYVRRKRYKVHDPEEKCSPGDKVRIVESRPVSKEKKWKIDEILETPIEPGR